MRAIQFLTGCFSKSANNSPKILPVSNNSAIEPYTITNKSAAERTNPNGLDGEGVLSSQVANAETLPSVGALEDEPVISPLAEPGTGIERWGVSEDYLDTVTNSSEPNKQDGITGALAQTEIDEYDLDILQLLKELPKAGDGKVKMDNLLRLGSSDKDQCELTEEEMVDLNLTQLPTPLPKKTIKKYTKIFTPALPIIPEASEEEDGVDVSKADEKLSVALAG